MSVSSSRMLVDYPDGLNSECLVELDGAELSSRLRTWRLKRTCAIPPSMNRYKSQVREVINRNSLVSLALSMGFNAFLPVYDGGVDFILYNEHTGDVRKVQLKGRWTIEKKYLNRDIWIAFHNNGRWYLAPHDEMASMAVDYGFTATSSWISGGAYSCPRLSKQMLNDMIKFRFEALDLVSEKAAAR